MSKKITKHQILILTLFLLSAVLVAVWCYVTPARNIRQAAQQIEQIAREVRQEYASKIDYWGLNTQFVVDNNLLTNLSYSDNEIKNALNKPVLIGDGQNGETVMPGERSFEIVYAELSKGECIALASFPFERPEELGLLEMTIVSKENAQTFRWGEENNKLPISRQNAQKFCGDYSKILWTIE